MKLKTTHKLREKVDQEPREKAGQELQEKASQELREKAGQEPRAKVQIYTATHIYSGDIHCPRQRRILDMLNGIPIGTSSKRNDFIILSNASIHFPNDPKQKVKTVWVNKTGFLFLKELEGRVAGVGGTGSRLYPYVAKTPRAVKLYLPSYTLTGQIHCAKKRGIADELNSEPLFIALTDVDICPVAGKGQSGVSFIAVNKEHVRSVAEI